MYALCYSERCRRESNALITGEELEAGDVMGTGGKWDLELRVWRIDAVIPRSHLTRDQTGRAVSYQACADLPQKRH